jgi:conjugal transfer mating pair stabilization protein TraN
MARRCLKNIEYNCCSDSGIIKEMIGCSDEAKDLQDKNKEKLCVFTGSWRTRSNKVWSRAQSYCCFNSRLARIIQTEGRRQLGIGWGDRKNPDCRPLSLAEMKRIDFSKIDFSELYDELKQKATQDFAKAKADMKSAKFQASDFSDGINSKLKKFYEK